MPVAVPLAIAGASVAGAAISSRASSSAANTQAAASDRAAELQNQQFQQLLQLQMPAYNRANAAGDIYSQALGIGGGGSQPTGSSYSGSSQYTGTPIVGDPRSTGPTRFALGGRTDPEAYAGMMTGGAQTQPQATATQPGGMTGGGQLDIASQVMNTPGYQAQLDQGIKSIDRAAPLTGGMYSGRRMKALNDYGQNTFGSYYNDWMNRVGGVAGQAQQIGSNIGQQGMQNAQNVGNLMMTGANARAQGQMNSASAWTGAIGTGIGLYGGSQGWFGG